MTADTKKLLEFDDLIRLGNNTTPDYICSTGLLLVLYLWKNATRLNNTVLK